jgi:hypothetical protein
MSTKIEVMLFQNAANAAVNKNPGSERVEAVAVTRRPPESIEQSDGGSERISAELRPDLLSSDNRESTPHCGQSATPSLMLIASEVIT